MNITEQLEAALVYCEAARHTDKLSLCKLLIRDEIQPAIEKALKQIRELPDYRIGQQSDRMTFK